VAGPAVPTVDLRDPDPAALRALDAACADHGFFLLEGHGCTDTFVRAWDATRRFFAADRALRVAIMRDRDNPMGYFDRELTKRRRDHKEVFDFVDPASARTDAHNRWPAGLPGFRDAMAELYDALSALADRALDLVLDAAGVSAGGRERLRCSRRGSSIRLNHYPVGDPVPAAEREGLAALGETALGHHTDPGILTLLLQDEVGGLQTRARDGRWLDVVPRADAIVVNLGDCMQAATNDAYRAAVHRVLPMTARSRYSIPYFGNPPRDAMVEPLAELAAGAPRYRPFAWRDFSDARAYDNFTDLGVDDAQVSDYRIAAPG
jgi:isopenicillin N synthase-like dioxygenase